jgi:hypothetical protein
VNELHRAGELLLAIGAENHSMQLIVIDGEPMSKARARFGKHKRVYTPAGVTAAEEALASSRTATTRARWRVALTRSPPAMPAAPDSRRTHPTVATARGSAG